MALWKAAHSGFVWFLACDTVSFALLSPVIPAYWNYNRSTNVWSLTFLWMLSQVRVVSASSLHFTSTLLSLPVETCGNQASNPFPTHLSADVLSLI